MAVLERHADSGRDLVLLDEAVSRTVLVGKSSTSDVVIDDDPTVSRVHARLEAVGPTWFVEDMNSTNGTFVNAERLLGKRMLHDQDELLLGRTKLVFRDLNARRTHGETTEPLGKPPKVTEREKDVLVELCRPILSGKAFRPPASDKEIGDALFISPAGVRQHLLSLYDKFGIYPDGGAPRRLRLANAALQTGVVTLRDLTERSGSG